MGLFQIIAEFFKTIFSPTSPESLQRQAVRKIESELKNLAPGLYKNGLVMPDFAEVLRVLFINTTPIFDILSETHMLHQMLFLLLPMHPLSSVKQKKMPYDCFDSQF